MLYAVEQCRGTLAVITRPWAAACTHILTPELRRRRRLKNCYMLLRNAGVLCD